jgi:hypothetical protein
VVVERAARPAELAAVVARVVEVEEGLSITEAAKAAGICDARKLRRLMTCETHIERQLLVLRKRCASDARVLQCATMAGVGDQRRLHG